MNSNSSNIFITKRNGEKEPLDINKLHKVVEYSCNGISGVSASELELRSHIQFYDGIKSSEIQEMLIKSSADLISEETPGYQYVGGRLINYHLRKDIYNQFEPISLYEHVLNVCNDGFYTNELLQWYTKEEFDKMDTFIDHSRDEDLTYAAMEQFRGKYLVKNRVTGKFYETPQMVYILIAATLFNSYPKAKRLKWVREYYDMISTHVISLPTPVMAGVRTPQKQFSSCVLISSGDSLKSINASASAVVNYVAQKAGIGLNVGRIRTEGSPIRGGDAYHTGIIPFLKYYSSAVNSCNQGGIRKGSCTVYFPIWRLDIEDLLVLKNNKGTEENRVRQMDYAVQINKLFYERLIENKDITLFCPNDVPGLYDAFFQDQDKFKDLYEKAERNTKLRKKKIKAVDLFNSLMSERKNTGRIYIMNVDLVNQHGSFKPDLAPVYQSNLCCEVTIPTLDMGTSNSEIATCTLSAINMGKINSPEDFKKPCELAVRALDALLDYQDYPEEEAKRSTMAYRPLGVGVTNLAYWLAKNGLSYEGNNETYEAVDEYAEAWSYYLTRASVDLAKEKGACASVKNTKYSDGIVPMDTYKEEQFIVQRKKLLDWDNLREDLKIYGIRNATLMAIMPVETSSVISNSTNGIEPPRSFISYKQSKDGVLKQVVPGFPRLKKKYQLLWDLKSPEGYLKIASIFQKYMDQTISTNTSYNPELYDNEEIPMSKLMGDLLLSYKLGLKTLYYLNTNDGAGEITLTNVEKTDNIIELKTDKNESRCVDGACML